MVAAIGLALVVAAPARGGVLVPFDPGLLGYCGAASGNLVAVGRMDADYGLMPLALSESGGPARTLDGPIGCPVLDAAADGTAVIATHGSTRPTDRPTLLVRRPDGDLRTALRLSGRTGGPFAAAAPGGWAAAAWLESRRGAGQQLVGVVYRPDGGSSGRRVLDRVAPDAGHLSVPVVGIDASGNASFAWTMWQGERHQRIRTTQAIHGSVWTPMRELPAGDPIVFEEDRDVVDLAVSPGGRTLLAWTTTKGIRATIDGTPALDVTNKRGVRSPHAEIADDGTAFIAFAKQIHYDAQIFVVDHRPGTGWSSPRELTTPDTPAPATFENGDLPVPFIYMTTALGPDGHAAVAWDNVTGAGAGAGVGVGVAAALRDPGRMWSDAAFRSPVTRSARLQSVSLDAAGRPLLLWQEGQFGYLIDPPRDRLRGARLVADADAPPRDDLAPAVTTSLPSQVRVSRTGRYVLDVVVGCAEACDARVRVLRRAGHTPPYEQASAVADIAAGATAELSLITGPESRRDLRRRLPRGLRLDVIVTDAAGNVSRRSRAVTAVRR